MRTLSLPCGAARALLTSSARCDSFARTSIFSRSSSRGLERREVLCERHTVDANALDKRARPLPRLGFPTVRYAHSSNISNNVLSAPCLHQQHTSSYSASWQTHTTHRSRTLRRRDRCSRSSCDGDASLRELSIFYRSHMPLCEPQRARTYDARHAQHSMHTHLRCCWTRDGQSRRRRRWPRELFGAAPRICQALAAALGLLDRVLSHPAMK